MKNAARTRPWIPATVGPERARAFSTSSSERRPESAHAEIASKIAP
jgi:hypothetical protein